jgi:hypothetical protein
MTVLGRAALRRPSSTSSRSARRRHTRPTRWLGQVNAPHAQLPRGLAIDVHGPAGARLLSTSARLYLDPHRQDHYLTHLVHHGHLAIRGDRFMNVTSHAHGMGSNSSEYRALQRERERRRRQQQQSARHPPLPDRATAEDSARAGTRRAAATTCGWCQRAITPRPRGPIPKWCSATCRHRAWEQARAAASGRSAVEIVERVVTVPATPPASALRPRQLAWVDLLRQLAVQVEQGTVYDRHLAVIAAALDDVMRAVHRRGSTALRPSSRWPAARG